MNDQPKPAGEWTVTFPIGEVSLNGEVFPRTYQDAIQRIADSHNAALAEATDAAVQEMLLVKQQLAAERGRTKTL